MKGSLVRRYGRGEASVWTLRVDYPRSKGEVRRQKAMSFTGDRASAEEALRRFVQRMAKSGEDDPTSDLKLNELYALWRESDSSRQRPRAMSTQYHDDRRWTNWLAPRFGDRVASDINEIEVEDFYKEIRRDRVDPKNPKKRIKGLSPNSVARVHSLLAAVLNWGYRRKYITTNPIEHVTKPRGESLPPRAPTIEEVNALLDYLLETDALMWLAVRVTCTLGLRRSELLALKYGDVVLDPSSEKLKGSIRIEKGVVRIPGDDHQFIQTATKSGAPSHRTLGMDEELCVVFDELIKEEQEMWRAEHADPRMHWDSYIFSDDLLGFEPWYPDTLSHKLAAARKMAGVTGGRRTQSRVPITFRSLRIYCASQAYAKAMDVRTMKAVLGHATIATSDRYYLAFEDEKLRDATVIIGELHRRKPVVEKLD
jgi:integrase